MSPKKTLTAPERGRAGGPRETAAHPAHASADRPGATRRRGATLENALLDAAWDELQSSGYAKLTMERVADRAGTSRAVIYRRWRNRAELAIAALRHRQPVLSGETPDTGTLRGDVVALMQRTSERITAIGPETVVGLLSDLLSDPEVFDRVQEQVLRTGGEVMASLLQRAATRGEVRRDVSPRVARLPLDLLRYELILTHQPPSEGTIDEIVDDVFLPLVRS
jgi:AcrR family transcriptional regulator